MGIAVAALGGFPAAGESASATQSAATTRSKNDRPGIGMIGCGGIANFHAAFVKPYGDFVALCDVDREHLAKFNEKHAGGKAWTSPDYSELLARPDVDMVWICTPDHWHTKIAIDAMRAGKDVYLEKPATLTVDEGRILCDVTRQTGRVLQVGTQQRQDDEFLTAVALVHAGRLGKIQRVTIAVGDTPKGKDFKPTAVPQDLDWDRWLGQTPKVPYIRNRCHNEFRWWYEYSGGRITDWGAHHVDIAQWAVAPELAGPATIEPLDVEHPIPLESGQPTRPDGFNTAAKFKVRCMFANGVEMIVADRAKEFAADNGILFEGDAGYLFCNRSIINGLAALELEEKPLPAGMKLPIDKKIEQPHQRQIADFIACCRTRSKPRSDIWTHHRTLTTCHLSNIAMRLGRKIQWDGKAQQIVGDDEANGFLKREQRKGFEIV